MQSGVPNRLASRVVWPSRGSRSWYCLPGLLVARALLVPATLLCRGLLRTLQLSSVARFLLSSCAFVMRRKSSQAKHFVSLKCQKTCLRIVSLLTVFYVPCGAHTLLNALASLVQQNLAVLLKGFYCLYILLIHDFFAILIRLAAMF